MKLTSFFFNINVIGTPLSEWIINVFLLMGMKLGKVKVLMEVVLVDFS